MNNFKNFGGRGGFNRGNDRGGDRAKRVMHQAVCGQCGKECQVPFRPSGDRPVLCSDCFEKSGSDTNSRFDRPRRDFGERRPNPQAQNQNNDLLVSINAKLGKILELMTEKKVTKKIKKVGAEKSAENIV